MKALLHPHLFIVHVLVQKLVSLPSVEIIPNTDAKYLCLYYCKKSKIKPTVIQRASLPHRTVKKKEKREKESSLIIVSVTLFECIPYN